MGRAEFVTVHAHFNLRNATKTRWADYLTPFAICEAILLPQESSPLVLAAFSIPSWLKWRKSTKTRGADFEDARNWKSRFRCSRISPSCFGSFFHFYAGQTDETRPKRDGCRRFALSYRFQKIFLGGNKTGRFLSPNGGV